MEANLIRVVTRSGVLLFILCMVASAQSIKPADNSVLDDHSHVDVRLTSEAALDKFRNDADFNYDRDVEYGKTL